jgi:hypothetical protein
MDLRLCELSIVALAGFPTLKPSYDAAGINATETVHGFKKFFPLLCKKRTAPSRAKYFDV